MEGSKLEACLRASFPGSTFIMRPPYGNYPEKASVDEVHHTDDSYTEHFDAIDLSDFPSDVLKEDGMYFIDGAEDRYFMGYVEDDHNAYPVYVGDVAVCCCELYKGLFTSYHDYHSLIISLPDTLFSEKNKALTKRLNQPGIGEILLCFLPYPSSEDKDSVARDMIHKYMRACEASVLEQLCEHNTSNQAKVFIDGHFPWNEKTIRSPFSKWEEKTGIESVISIDKRFSFQNCSRETREGLISLQNSIEDYIIREPSQVEKDKKKPDNKDVIWYLKLRDDPTAEGVTSDIIECACVFKGDEDNKKGVIEAWNKDLLSLACPTCYGIEDRNRWRTHIYPIFLTELRCKSIKLSPTTIKHLMYGTTKQ